MWKQCECHVKALWVQCESDANAMWKQCQCNAKAMWLQHDCHLKAMWMQIWMQCDFNVNATWNQSQCNLNALSMQCQTPTPHPPPVPPHSPPTPPKLLIALGRLMDIYIGVWGGKPNGKCSARDVCVRGFVALGGVDSDHRSILEGTSPPPPRGPRHHLLKEKLWTALSGGRGRGRGRGRGHGRGRGQIYRISSWIALKS